MVDGLDQKSVVDVLKELSELDFLVLGREEIAYMRPISIDGEEAVELHAADGTTISVLDTTDLAIAKAKQQDLKALALH